MSNGLISQNLPDAAGNEVDVRGGSEPKPYIKTITWKMPEGCEELRGAIIFCGWVTASDPFHNTYAGLRLCQYKYNTEEYW